MFPIFLQMPRQTVPPRSDSMLFACALMWLLIGKFILTDDVYVNADYLFI